MNCPSTLVIVELLGAVIHRTIPVSDREAWETCGDIIQARQWISLNEEPEVDFIHPLGAEPEEEPIGCAITRRPGVIHVRWYPTEGADETIARSRLAAVLEGKGFEDE